MEKEKKKKIWMLPTICILGSFLLYGILFISGKGGDEVSAQGRIYREKWGGEAKDYPIWVEGLEEERISVTVTVGPRVYSKEEADEAFQAIMDTMEVRIRGENPSLMEVQTDLDLPTLSDEGIRLKWYSSDSNMINASGKLMGEVEKEQDVILSVELSAGDYRQNYEIPIRILPQERSQKEKQLKEFLKELNRQDMEQNTRPWLELPRNFNGKELRYQFQKEDDSKSILLIGVVLAVLLVMREKSQTKQNNQKRERELLLDYADVLSKIMVLTGAGLTVRNSWERMVMDYEEALEQKKKKPRAAYEEMRRTYYQLKSGMAEGAAYQEFGRRCKLQPYLKLSGLLEQNRKSGTKNMRGILQAEMADALEQRKNLARRLGEEAGTRLLLPLFMLLGIVMVMIMVPAMMTMG